MEPLRTNTPDAAVPVAWSAERRQRNRNKIVTPAYASFNGTNALDLHEILDLHEEGFGAQAPAGFSLNQRVSLRLVLSEAASPVSAEGRVAWTSQGRLGVQFESLPPEDLAQLQRWLNVNAMNAAADGTATDSAALSAEEPARLRDRSSLLTALDAVRREVNGLAHDPAAALQLLADRAVAFTGATGGALALQESNENELVCRARCGSDAPPLGASFKTGSGFSGECVRRRTMLRCDDPETDPYVDRESCRALGIGSILAVPLMSSDRVAGLLEVFSPNRRAFNERDEEVLTRMAEFAAAVVREPARPAVETAASFPFSASLQDKPQNAFRKSHVILLIAAAALLALVVGYLVAPWLQRLFTRPSSPSSPRGSLTQPEQPAPKPVKLNVTQATTLEQMRELAEGGDPAAQFGLGAHYAIGDGVKLDNAEAARWFMRAAEQGHVIAQDTMGAYYWAGRGVPKDLRKAYFWSLLGRAGNNETSKYRIVALNSLLPREEIEAARQDAEQWVRQHAVSSKPGSPHP